MSKKSILLLALSLNACGDQTQLPADKGKNYAKAVKQEIHTEYLNCYALVERDKRECLDTLSVRYVEKRWQQDKEYVLAFQYESEKLGFKQFINNHKLPCDRIEEGPIFSSDKQAYLVTCKPKGQYFMRFNYETKSWAILKEKDQND